MRIKIANPSAAIAPATNLIQRIFIVVRVVLDGGRDWIGLASRDRDSKPEARDPKL
ncbi:MAG TPA: hypothetical protein VNP98_05605 [Chthoniobacterales bacterium]|nr:hypothetical protein [Chthoniobacterales bacterium]